MPLITLEYSSNLIDFDTETATNFLLDTHITIAKIINTKVESCKSRIICHNHTVVGAGGDDKGFVILTIEILPGRDDATRQALGETLLASLNACVAGVQHFQDVQLSVHVKELSDHYFREHLTRL